jgi:hypothetical protein
LNVEQNTYRETTTSKMLFNKDFTANRGSICIACAVDLTQLHPKWCISSWCRVKNNFQIGDAT